MQKFEINNPEALKLIADLKSGAYIKPYIAKAKKLKMVFIGVGVFLFLLIFVAIGKALSGRVTEQEYVPPSWQVESMPTTAPVNSPYNSLKEEIFLFSADLPDPIIPDISNTIDLRGQEF